MSRVNSKLFVGMSLSSIILKRWLPLLSILVYIAIVTLIYTGKSKVTIISTGINWTLTEGLHITNVSLVQDASRKIPPFNFDPHGIDTLVMLHLQKTGGSEFLSYLVKVTKNGKDLCKIMETQKERQVKEELRRQGKLTTFRAQAVSSCPRNPLKLKGEQWLISERTTAWKCGVHASYTEFRECIPALKSPLFNRNRKFFYAVILRHPLERYVSEFLHVKRGATWISQHICNGKPVSPKDMPPCYPGYYNREKWPNLTLSGFMSCESNWGNNRQTMMLADLEAVDCFQHHNVSEEVRKKILLETAIKNLKSFSFFGITEYMDASFDLFEKQFGMKFPIKPKVRSQNETYSGSMLSYLNNKKILNTILQINDLDMELYTFALKLFLERAQNLGIIIKNLKNTTNNSR